MRRARPADPERHFEPGVAFDALPLHVERQVDEHRRGAAGGHDAECLATRPWCLCGPERGDRPPGHRPRDRGDPGPLEVRLVQLRFRRLAGDADDRKRVGRRPSTGRGSFRRRLCPSRCQCPRRSVLAPRACGPRPCARRLPRCARGCACTPSSARRRRAAGSRPRGRRRRAHAPARRLRLLLRSTSESRSASLVRVTRGHFARKRRYGRTPDAANTRVKSPDGGGTTEGQRRAARAPVRRCARWCYRVTTRSARNPVGSPR